MRSPRATPTKGIGKTEAPLHSRLRPIKDAGEYLESLLRKAKEAYQDGESARPHAQPVARAIAGLNELRIGARLNGLTIRELIEER